jgi:GNAT superfamily N-acetyltransferase
MEISTPDLENARIVDQAEAEAFRDMYAAAPDDFRRGTGMRCIDVGGATVLLAPGIPAPIFNRAIGLGVFREASEADLDEVVSASRAAECRNFWIHLNPIARPATLESWLGARGFRPAKRRAWAKMIFGGAASPPARTSLVIREVGREHAKDLASVLVTAFDMPPGVASWFDAMVGRAGWHAIAGFDGDAIVCGGFLYRGQDVAWLGVGGTLPAFRGRGGQRAMMAERIRIALEHGIRNIATETGEPVGDESNPSLLNMHRSGFRQVCSRLNYEPG